MRGMRGCLWDLGCAWMCWKNRMEYKKDFNWMDTTQRTGKSLLSHCAYTPFELRYDVFEMLIPLLHWDGRMHKEGIDQKPVGMASLTTQTIFVILRNEASDLEPQILLALPNCSCKTIQSLRPTVKLKQLLLQS